MPTIGWFEILIIVAIAIIVVGPKDFPLMLKKVGSWLGSIKRYVNNVQSEVSSITEDTIDKNLNEDISVNTKKDKDEQKSD
jgi:sec-independent protein translocase protein TatB